MGTKDAVVNDHGGLHGGDARMIRRNDLRAGRGIMESFGSRVKVRYGGALAARNARKDQRAGLFVSIHLAEQVRHTVLNGLAVVLVDIQRTVAVEVLEVQAVHLDELVLGRGAQLGLIAIGLNVVESGYAFLDDALFRHGGPKRSEKPAS